MLTKSKIVLSALLVVGFASTALATERPDAWLGQTEQSSPALKAYAYAPARHSVKRFTAEERAMFKRATHSVSGY